MNEYNNEIVVRDDGNIYPTRAFQRGLYDVDDNALHMHSLQKHKLQSNDRKLCCA